MKGQVNLDFYAIWQDETQPDSLRSNAYADYIWDGYLFSQPDSAFILAEELVDFGLNKPYLKAQFAGYTAEGVSWENRSDYPKTLHYYNRALNIAKRMGHPAALAIAYNNVGSIYHDLADYPKALDHYIKSLEYKETNQIGPTLPGNIGGIYMEQGNYSKALEYIQRSQTSYKLKGDQSGEAIALSKIGDIYRKQKDYSKSLDYYTQSLTIYNQAGHQIGIANTYSNIGLVYEMQETYPTALDYHQKASRFMNKVMKKMEWLPH